jgi:hypothetical protein
MALVLRTHARACTRRGEAIRRNRSQGQPSQPSRAQAVRVTAPSGLAVSDDIAHADAAHVRTRSAYGTTASFRTTRLSRMRSARSSFSDTSRACVGMASKSELCVSSSWPFILYPTPIYYVHSCSSQLLVLSGNDLTKARRYWMLAWYPIY